MVADAGTSSESQACAPSADLLDQRLNQTAAVGTGSKSLKSFKAMPREILTGQEAGIRSFQRLAWNPLFALPTSCRKASTAEAGNILLGELRPALLSIARRIERQRANRQKQAATSIM
jgi:hypothetical protein